MHSLKLLAIATVLGTASFSFAQSQQPKTVTPDQIQFKDRPGAPAATTLYGDPSKPGLYVQRVKLAKGQKIMPHYHPDERTVVVIQGTMYLGSGETFDESKMTALPAGSFFTEPPKAPHYNWAKDGDVIVNVTGIGPTGSFPFGKK